MSETNKTQKAKKPITRLARTFRQRSPTKMNPYFSRMTSYSYSNINGQKQEKLQDIFGEGDRNGFHYGERFTRENKNGKMSERLKILEPHEMESISFRRFQEHPVLSIFHEPRNIFDIFQPGPQLKHLKYGRHNR